MISAERAYILGPLLETLQVEIVSAKNGYCLFIALLKANCTDQFAKILPFELIGVYFLI